MCRLFLTRVLILGMKDASIVELDEARSTQTEGARACCWKISSLFLEAKPFFNNVWRLWAGLRLVLNFGRFEATLNCISVSLFVNSGTAATTPLGKFYLGNFEDLCHWAQYTFCVADEVSKGKQKTSSLQMSFFSEHVESFWAPRLLVAKIQKNVAISTQKNKRNNTCLIARLPNMLRQFCSLFSRKENKLSNYLDQRIWTL